MGGNLSWQHDQSACSNTVRELYIPPEVFQNSRHVALATSVKSTDPDGGLGGFPQVPQVCGEDAIQAAPVFAITNKGSEFIP